MATRLRGLILGAGLETVDQLRGGQAATKPNHTLGRGSSERGNLALSPSHV